MNFNDKYLGSGPHWPQDNQEAGIATLLSLTRTASPSAPLSGQGIPEPPSSAWPSLTSDLVSQQPITRPPVGNHQSLPGLLAVRFGVVAASCALIQLLVLKLLSHLGVNKILANGIGFAAFAQIFSR